MRGRRGRAYPTCTQYKCPNLTLSRGLRQREEEVPSAPALTAEVTFLRGGDRGCHCPPTACHPSAAQNPANLPTPLQNALVASAPALRFVSSGTFLLLLLTCASLRTRTPRYHTPASDAGGPFYPEHLAHAWTSSRRIFSVSQEPSMRELRPHQH